MSAADSHELYMQKVNHAVSSGKYVGWRIIPGTGGSMGAGYLDQCNKWQFI